MKKQLIFYYFFLFTLSLSAQKDNSGCSIIVLENDNEITAIIEGVESGLLFYKKCPDSSNQEYSIPTDIVKHIREPNGEVHPVSTINRTITPVPNQSKKNGHQHNSWIFRNKTKNKVRTILSHQNVKVIYTYASNKRKRVKGKWNTLTKNALILVDKNNSEIKIPKKDIVKIVVFKKNKGLGKAIWIAILTIGGVAALISFLLAV